MNLTFKDEIDLFQFHNEDLSLCIYFNNFENTLLELISEYRSGIILGCISWFDNLKIIKEFSTVNNCSLIIDEFTHYNFKNNQDNKAAIKSIIENYKNINFPLKKNIVSESNTFNNFIFNIDKIEGVRLYGFPDINNNKKRFLHHKFLLFGKFLSKDDVTKIQFDKLWTGSFNLSYKSNSSLENVICLTSKNKNSQIFTMYFNEYAQALMYSKPLSQE